MHHWFLNCHEKGDSIWLIHDFPSNPSFSDKLWKRINLSTLKQLSINKNTILK
ncbi:hypothetical protein ABWED_2194 [Acinetobacter lwoffii]|nr:hypothetical protein ABVS_2429 [Acinetobacter lwoffii]UVB01453.1 hypothetical protein ABWED_2194 [Acinetobacter lwoffii]